MHTTSYSHNTDLHAMIRFLLLGRSEDPLLQELFEARALATAPSNILLEEPSPSITPDEVDLHRQDRVRITRLRCGFYLALRSYENRLYLDIVSACWWCGIDPQMVSRIYQKCPQLTGERVKFPEQTP